VESSLNQGGAPLVSLVINLIDQEALAAALACALLDEIQQRPANTALSRHRRYNIENRLPARAAKFTDIAD
jgi:hypothetical protein